jgi:hypothetical protein
MWTPNQNHQNGSSMRGLERFICLPILHPRGERQKYLVQFLWRAGQKREGTPLATYRNPRNPLYELFEYNSCACCKRWYTDIELHHIVPWREAFAIYDGDHEWRGRNLIPLCPPHHGDAKVENIRRNELVELRESRSAVFAGILWPMRNDVFADFQAQITQGKYARQLNGFERQVRHARTEGDKVKALMKAASASRRTGWKGIKKSLSLLGQVIELVPTADHRIWTEIYYEKMKCYQLTHEFDAAEDLIKASQYEADSLFTNNRNSFVARWVSCLKETGGGGRWEAAEVSLESDCGITQFKKHLHETGEFDLAWKKFYVYMLHNVALHHAQYHRFEEAFKNLAAASDWIDQYRLKELRPRLYQILALTFYERGDWWRSLLAASASGALSEQLGRQENKGLTALVFLQSLHKLDLPALLDEAIKGISIDREMNNQWAYDKIAKRDWS